MIITWEDLVRGHMLTSIVITKNEEQMIGDCLLSLKFSDEIIVVDTGNTDKTNEIATSHKAKIVKSGGKDYSQFRNAGLKAAKGDWVLYVDADERVTPLLRSEIAKKLKSGTASAYAIPRQNIYLGKEMHYGGWSNDYVIRLFQKSKLSRWVHPLHEEPEYEGELGRLENKLVHISHRDLTSMLNKTLDYTTHESDLRLQASHPPVVTWRIARVMFTEFWLRFIKLSAWRDGAEGIIDGLFQVFNSFVIYTRLWEMQVLKKPVLVK